MRGIRLTSLYGLFLAGAVLLPITFSKTERCNPHDKSALFKIKQSFGNPYLLASWTHDSDCCTSWYQVECDRTTNRIISLTIFAGGLSGQLPPSIGDLPFLEHLTFRKLTNVTGPIQPAIAKLNRLNFLRLDHLNLTGSVPGWLGQMKSLTFIDLSFNSLTGSIPSELARLPNLEALHLDRNKLTGRIPDSFGKFPKSPSLYLSHNQLSGPIPASMANYNTDSGIDLSRNRLEGDASILFGGDKSTWSVDLSRNLRPQCNRKRMEGSTSPPPSPLPTTSPHQPLADEDDNEEISNRSGRRRTPDPHPFCWLRKSDDGGS